jgi:hypothetical protein
VSGNSHPSLQKLRFWILGVHLNFAKKLGDWVMGVLWVQDPGPMTNCTSLRAINSSVITLQPSRKIHQLQHCYDQFQMELELHDDAMIIYLITN